MTVPLLLHLVRKPIVPPPPARGLHPRDSPSGFSGLAAHTKRWRERVGQRKARRRSHCDTAGHALGSAASVAAAASVADPHPATVRSGPLRMTISYAIAQIPAGSQVRRTVRRTRTQNRTQNPYAEPYAEPYADPDADPYAEQYAEPVRRTVRRTQRIPGEAPRQGSSCRGQLGSAYDSTQVPAGSQGALEMLAGVRWDLRMKSRSFIRDFTRDRAGPSGLPGSPGDACGSPLGSAYEIAQFHTRFHTRSRRSQRTPRESWRCLRGRRHSRIHGDPGTGPGSRARRTGSDRAR